MSDDTVTTSVARMGTAWSLNQPTPSSTMSHASVYVPGVDGARTATAISIFSPGQRSCGSALRAPSQMTGVLPSNQ